MSTSASRLNAIHLAIAAALGVNPTLLRSETRIYEDVSAEPISLQAILAKLEERFSIDFTLNEVACLHGNNALTVGDLIDTVDAAVERAAEASLDEAVSRIEEALA